MRIDRYGDIFSGYFSQACARSLGHGVRVGTPVATHARNSHNYLRDAAQEHACICLLEDLLPWLRERQLAGNTYAETYLSLSDALEEASGKFKGFIWTEETRQFFSATTRTMREWVRELTVSASESDSNYAVVCLANRRQPFANKYSEHFFRISRP